MTSAAVTNAAVTSAAVIGLDIGTTTSKAVVVRDGLPGRVLVEQRTPWHVRDDRYTDIDADVLVELALGLLHRAVRAAEAEWGRTRVRGIGVAGLGESGILLDAAGRPAFPAVAWFDPRGADGIAAVRERDPGFAERFPTVTGLPWTRQASIAKLLHIAAGTHVEPGSCWLSVPEWIVHALGGERCSEPSLASRTGLLDQDTGRVWDEALEVAGLPAGLLPDLLPAGEPAGAVTHPNAPAQTVGAVLCVAGHDHPVAAIGAGAVGRDELFNSSGTADVVARSLPGLLDGARRAQLVAAGWSAGRHVLPDTSLLLAGGSGGLLLRRVLGARGADNVDAREALDVAALNVGKLPPGLSICGDGRVDDGVVVRLGDDASPAAIWAAAARYTAALNGELLAAIEPIVGPHRRATAAGGWTRMHSIRASRADVFGALHVDDGDQPGATGAALIAGYALTDRTTPLAAYARASQETRVPITEGRS